jgi:ferrochelatase
MSQPATTPKTAVVLMNLGGPDQMSSVYPFLLNLFSDPTILRVPFFVRPLLARIIAGARKKPASENYKLLGGKSPLLELTQEQARSLEAALGDENVNVSSQCATGIRSARKPPPR